MTRSMRVPVTLLALLAALLCFAAAGATAFAVPGDSISTATSLNSYVGSSLTTDLVTDTMFPTGHYYFRVQLSGGTP